MFIEVMKSKIHRATVTEADLNYVGSVTIDEDLIEAANLLVHEKDKEASKFIPWKMKREYQKLYLKLKI